MCRMALNVCRKSVIGATFDLLCRFLDNSLCSDQILEFQIFFSYFLMFSHYLYVAVRQNLNISECNVVIYGSWSVYFYASSLVPKQLVESNVY